MKIYKNDEDVYKRDENELRELKFLFYFFYIKLPNIPETHHYTPTWSPQDSTPTWSLQDSTPPFNTCRLLYHFATFQLS